MSSNLIVMENFEFSQIFSLYLTTDRHKMLKNNYCEFGISIYCAKIIYNCLPNFHLKYHKLKFNVSKKFRVYFTFALNMLIMLEYIVHNSRIIAKQYK